MKSQINNLASQRLVWLDALLFAFVVAYFIQMLSYKINKPIISNILGV